MNGVVSVDNVVLWDRHAGLAEAVRVLRPGGLLVITVHRHVLDSPPEQPANDVAAVGLVDVSLQVRPRRMNSPAIEVVARRPTG